MSNKFLVFSPKNSPRLQYILDLIFTNILGLDVIFTQSSHVFKTSSLPKIHYGNQAFSEGEIFIKSTGILFENSIIKRDFIKEFQYMDTFSKIFVLVSRYEEYIAPPSVLDAHQRFSAQKSISSALGILDKPVVNQWILELCQKILLQYPNLKITRPQYQVQLTYDIDQAWAFKNKGSFRNLGGLLKDILKFNIKNIKTRISVIGGWSNDPEYTFEYIEKLHKKHSNAFLKPLFFWLLGDYGEHDKNIHWENKNLQRLIKRLAKKYLMGIHPSYTSNENPSILKQEIQRLAHILSHTEGYSAITKSRQHYLKLHLPTTYRNLIEMGITDDYSMGYSDNIGFRAGIATSFYWYDLEKEEITSLRVHPFQVMEVTLNEYLQLSPEEAVMAVKPIIKAIQEVGGTFTTLWHNSTLTDDSNSNGSLRPYQGWRKVYEDILEMSLKMEN